MSTETVAAGDNSTELVLDQLGAKPQVAPIVGYSANSCTQRITMAAMSLLIDELAATDGVKGCLCLGYRFQPPGKPLTLQGERDTFGKRNELESYALPSRVQLEWIPSGDHSFKPTKSSSGRSEAENWATAVVRSDGLLGLRLGFPTPARPTPEAPPALLG